MQDFIETGLQSLLLRNPVPKAFTYPALRSTRENFKCPSCGQALILNADSQPKTYSCSNRHSFDMAREGYLNLLLAQHKRSRNPGDSDDMIRSRQRFLMAGYYNPLSDAIVAQVAKSANGFNQTLIDLGCGEGHYLQQLRNVSAELKLLGLDISKFAVRLAAKRKMDARLVVDSAFNIPLFENRLDTAISVFSPISSDETARILKPGGTLIMVGPGEQHLSGLTALIYDKTLPHAGNPVDVAAQFSLQESIEIKRDISVKGSDILDLLTMTPYYWQARPEQQAMLAKLQKLDTTIHFYINIYQHVSP
jgi:23S rRNA (guanine745-N1)-methyltransferase